MGNIQHISRKSDAIGDDLIGGNASAEGAEADEGVEDGGTVSGVNIVMDNRLQSTGFGTKKEYQVYMKVRVSLPESVNSQPCLFGWMWLSVERELACWGCVSISSAC